MQSTPSVSSETTDSDYSSDSSMSDGEERNIALDKWHGQAKSWIQSGSSVGSEEDEAAVGAVATNLGLRTSTWQTEQTRRTHVVMLDSLDRDQTVYPNPTAMRLKLPRIYKNVERIDIVQIKFINSVFTFADSRANTKFGWGDASGGYTFQLPEGTYTWTDLQGQFEAAGFRLTLNAATGIITISRQNRSIFSISWAPKTGGQTRWGMGWNLGFAKQNLGGQTSYSGQTWPRLFDDYVFLQLNVTEKMNSVDHTSPEQLGIWQNTTGQVEHYFGKLLLNNFGCWSQSMVESPKTFRPPLGRLDRITVNWLDSTGQAISGGAIGCDWHMTMRIVEYVEAPTTASALTLSSSMTPPTEIGRDR
jgi:hypothetical protein